MGTGKTRRRCGNSCAFAAPNPATTRPTLPSRMRTFTKAPLARRRRPDPPWRLPAQGHGPVEDETHFARQLVGPERLLQVLEARAEHALLPDGAIGVARHEEHA